MKVILEQNKIKEIEVVEAAGEDSAYLTMAKDIIDRILSEQTPEVDTVTGATFSSTGIKEAVKNALEEGLQS